MKKTEELPIERLIVQLASGVRAVTPLRPPSIRLAQWTGLTVVLAGLATFAIGPRADLSSAISAPAFAASLAFLVVATLGGASAAFVLSVPGAERSWAQRAVPIAAALAWPVVWILVLPEAPDSNAARPSVFHWACAIEIVGIAAVSGALLLGMIRRASPLRPAWTAATVSLAAIAAASAATQAICPLSDPAHQLFGHALVGMVAGLAGLLVGHRALRP